MTLRVLARVAYSSAINFHDHTLDLFIFCTHHYAVRPFIPFTTTVFKTIYPILQRSLQ